MKQNVIFQVRLLAESPVTDFALERPGAIMDVHVTTKISRRGEGFRAQRTFMRFFLKY